MNKTVKLIKNGWYYRWYGLAVAWALTICCWLIITYMPNSYAMQARVYLSYSTNESSSPDKGQTSQIREALLNAWELSGGGRSASEDGKDASKLHEGGVTRETIKELTIYADENWADVYIIEMHDRELVRGRRMLAAVVSMLLQQFEQGLSERSSVENARLRVLQEPEHVPSASWPDRAMLNFYATSVSILTGMVVSFYMAIRFPRIFSDLVDQHLIGIPIIGFFRDISADQKRRRQKREDFIFLFALAALPLTSFLISIVHRKFLL